VPCFIQRHCGQNTQRLLNALHKAIFFAAGPSGATSPATEGQGVAITAATQASSGAQPAIMTTTSGQQESSADLEFHSELLQTFIESAPLTIGGLRKLTQEFSKAQDETSRMPRLLELYRKVHALTSSAGIVGQHNISHVSTALQVLLKEFIEKPNTINASTMRTVAHSIDFIGEIFSKGWRRGSVGFGASQNPDRGR